MTDHPLRSAVVIASAGRASVLTRTIQHIAETSPPGTTISISVPDEASRPAVLPPGVIVDVGVRGASAQRNRAIERLEGTGDIVFFFDDDTMPHAGYIPAASSAFALDPQLVAVTGRVLADGALVGEIDADEALRLLGAATPPPTTESPAFTLYGCNFAVRSSALRKEGFDERLPLYSWLEDLDLSQRLKRHGRIARVHTAVCVHLGARSGGRASHYRLGYSQVVNPIYLRSKGSISTRRALTMCGRSISGNVYYSFAGAQPRGRRRRLLGNLQGLGDLLRGVIRPERILELRAG